jgi:hypothetical protein
VNWSIECKKFEKFSSFKIGKVGSDTSTQYSTHIFFRKVLNETVMHLQNVSDKKKEININKIIKIRTIP